MTYVNAGGIQRHAWHTPGPIAYTATMPSGSLSLAQIAARLPTLEVRCSKCDRRGRYRIATLIERYGADFAGPDLRDRLSADCAKHGAAEYERCDLYFPDMLRVS